MDAREKGWQEDEEMLGSSGNAGFMVNSYVNIIYIYTHLNGGCITFFLNLPLTSKSIAKVIKTVGPCGLFINKTDQNGGNPWISITP
jgi:hypothetical protein